MSVDNIRMYFDGIVNNAFDTGRKPGKIEAKLDVEQLKQAIGTQLDEEEEAAIDTYQKTVTFGRGGDAQVKQILATMPRMSAEAARDARSEAQVLSQSISNRTRQRNDTLKSIFQGKVFPNLATKIALTLCDEWGSAGVKAWEASSRFERADSGSRDDARLSQESANAKRIATDAKARLTTLLASAGADRKRQGFVEQLSFEISVYRDGREKMDKICAD